MSENRFSNSILLIGMTLIAFNTVSMIASIGYEFVVLVFSLIWSILKTVPNAIVNYPLSLLCLGLLCYFKKNFIA